MPSLLQSGGVVVALVPFRAGPPCAALLDAFYRHVGGQQFKITASDAYVCRVRVDWVPAALYQVPLLLKGCPGGGVGRLSL